MKEQFVTYEIALKLKELGFGEECLCTYVIPSRRFQRNPSNDMAGEEIEEPYTWKNSLIHKDLMTAPLWQQVIDWFREERDIYIYIKPGFDNLSKPEIYQWEMKIRNRVFIKDGDFKSYEEAREQAILKAIELCQKEK